MKRETQMQLIREAFAAIDRGAPPMSEAFTRNDPSAYTSLARAEREREVLFREFPILTAFSSQLRKPGDFVADDISVVPTLVVRGQDGRLRAFANICRH